MPITTSHTGCSRRLRLLLAAALLATGLGAGSPLAAQEKEAGSLLAAGAGGVVGLVAGGYGNLAIVVLKSRLGRYPHSFDDAFGWESIPLLTGGATGVAIGLLDSNLIVPWIIGGTAGFTLGAAAGLLYGELAWGDPESRWANAAITAAIGMTIGSTVGILRYSGSGSLEPDPESAVRVPLVRLSF